MGALGLGGTNGGESGLGDADGEEFGLVDLGSVEELDNLTCDARDRDVRGPKASGDCAAEVEGCTELIVRPRDGGL